ncbi:MAG: hypothetical protein J6A73_03685 [Lachnospiraceae bacterium]|nr:hypothetical protein [Lachnospiraceae bacterium]
MKEIGGYIELDTIKTFGMHEGAIALNTARNCLAYLIKARSISKILLPGFLCDSVKSICERENVRIGYYSVGTDFLPVDLSVAEDEWLYLVNYYGQLDNGTINRLAKKYKHIIVDNVQAYFQEPIEGVDTIYTCRKFFGVPDGAYLYTNSILNEELVMDESYARMTFLLGRYERTASEFYGGYQENENLLASEPLKKMSKLTRNMLSAIDYSEVKHVRTENYKILHDEFECLNNLHLKEIAAPFMYPLYVANGDKIRIELQKKKIYIPTLWPEVLKHCEVDSLDYDMAKNIVPLPVDQRYNGEDMLYIIREVTRCIEG